jgi:hypothetical protein
MEEQIDEFTEKIIINEKLSQVNVLLENDEKRNP